MRKVDASHVSLSLNETVELNELNELIQLFATFKGASIDPIQEVEATSSLREELQRKSSFLTHPIFNRYHSETEMMRYIKKLENKDFSLTHGMIPLAPAL